MKKRSVTHGVEIWLMLAIWSKRREGAPNGNQLLKLMDERGYKLYPGTTYKALATMEQRGLVKSYTVPPAQVQGGRESRGYRLTFAGTKTLLSMLDLADDLSAA